MHSIVLRISNSLQAKDSIAMLRGLYRVAVVANMELHASKSHTINQRTIHYGTTNINAGFGNKNNQLRVLRLPNQIKPNQSINSTNLANGANQQSNQYVQANNLLNNNTNSNQFQRDSLKINNRDDTNVQNQQLKLKINKDFEPSKNQPSTIKEVSNNKDNTLNHSFTNNIIKNNSTFSNPQKMQSVNPLNHHKVKSTTSQSSPILAGRFRRGFQFSKIGFGLINIKLKHLLWGQKVNQQGKGSKGDNIDNVSQQVSKQSEVTINLSSTPNTTNSNTSSAKRLQNAQINHPRPHKPQPHQLQMASLLSDSLCRMRGAPLKLAQMLSIQQQNLIPKQLTRIFQQARQQAHWINIELIQGEISSQFNGKGRKDVFEEFDDVPFAAASIGQVHRGVVRRKHKSENSESDDSKDDKKSAQTPSQLIQEVAIKIQYPSVSTSIQSDIANLRLLMKWPGLLPKTLYVDKLLDSAKDQLLMECDYEREANMQRKYDARLKHIMSHQYCLYKVPKIIDQFSTQKILVSQYVPGIALKLLQMNSLASQIQEIVTSQTFRSKYESIQQLRDEIGRRLMKLTLSQLFTMGIMQSDPNPANLSYNPQTDQLVLYDFGATHQYDQSFLHQYCLTIQNATLRVDKEAIWKHSIGCGLVSGFQSPQMKDAHIESILAIGEPIRTQGPYDFRDQDITTRIYERIPKMLRDRLKSPPKEVYSLHRKLSGTYLACVRMGARVDCSAILREIMSKKGVI